MTIGKCKVGVASLVYSRVVGRLVSTIDNQTLCREKMRVCTLLWPYVDAELFLHKKLLLDTKDGKIHEHKCSKKDQKSCWCTAAWLALNRLSPPWLGRGS